MIAQKTSEIISQLKEIRKTKGYSCQRICDMVEASGGYVSLATIKRVFADGSEERNFRYEDSIRPIAIALIGKDPTDPQGVDPMSLAEQEANVLRKIALLKEDMIQELHAENQRLQEEYSTRIIYLKEESEKKTEHIAALSDQLITKDKLIWSLTFGLIGLLMLICVVLLVDVAHLDIGFVRDIAGTPLAIVGVILALILVAVVYHVYRRATRK